MYDVIICLLCNSCHIAGGGKRIVIQLCLEFLHAEMKQYYIIICSLYYSMGVNARTENLNNYQMQDVPIIFSR